MPRNKIARELEAISQVLDANQDILDLVYCDLVKYRRKDTGRNRMTAEQVWEAGGEFAQRVKEDAEISQHLTPAEVAAIFDLNRYFRHVDEIFARVFGK